MCEKRIPSRIDARVVGIVDELSEARAILFLSRCGKTLRKREAEAKQLRLLVLIDAVKR
jgi:hypothetical protein